MTIVQQPWRGLTVARKAAFVFGDLTDETADPLIDVPAGAIVVGGGLYISTAWNSATTDVMDIGDGGDADRYTVAAIDATAADYTPLDLTGYEYTAADTIDVTWNGEGTAPSAGVGVLVVQYVIADESVDFAAMLSVNSWGGSRRAPNV